MSNYTFVDDSYIAFHPGFSVQEEVERSGLSQEDFAKKMNTTPKNLSLLINGEQRLTMDMAMKLSRTTGSSVDFWLKKQQMYDEKIAMMHAEEELVNERVVYKDMNYAYFKNHYSLPDHAGKRDEQIEEVRSFLHIATLSVLKSMDLCARYRNPEALTQGDIIRANAMMQIAINQVPASEISDFDRKRFNRLVAYMIELTADKEKAEEWKTILHDTGVIFIPMPEFKGTSIVSASKKVGHHILLVANMSTKKGGKPSASENVKTELEHIRKGEYGVTVAPA